MKKIISIIVILLLLIGGSFSAQSSENGIIGHIFSTDVLTYLNGKPIQGYNIGGRTVVLAEDFIGYGFHVEYSEQLRRLDIFSDFTVGDIEPEEIRRGKVGEILGTLYETDIVTYYNGLLIQGYNIGGKTAVCLEDLGNIEGSPNAIYGYSDYLGKSVWDEEKRIISYTSFLDNRESIVGVPGVFLDFLDNVISVTVTSDASYLQDRLNSLNGYSAGSGMAKYHLHLLYLDYQGEQTEIGYTVCHPCSDEPKALMHITNPEKVMELIHTYLLP